MKIIGRLVFLGWISFFLAAPLTPESGEPGIRQKSQSVKPENPKPSESSSAGGPQTAAGKSREISTLGKKRSLSPWIVGGAVVAGGVLAYFLFFKPKSSPKPKIFGQQTSLSSSVEIKAGNISIQSSPPGAAIFIDGAATGKITPATFEQVIVGTYALKLTKEGFKDFTTSVEVAADQTANVEAALSGHSIQVQAPAADSFLETGRTVPIRWASDATAAVQIPSVSGVLYMPEVAIALFQNGVKTAMISERTPNDGAFDWTIPTTLTPGRNFQIVVYCPTVENIRGAGGTFIIAARKTTKIQFQPDLHGGELDPGWNSYVAEVKKASGRIESFSYEIYSCCEVVDCTMFLVGPDGSQVKIFDREPSRWTRCTSPGDYGMELRLIDWAPNFKDLAVKGQWTLKVQVHNSYCCCIGRGGCGGITWSATVEYLEF